MPRSAEALKRRAEKRNISEKEMRKLDAQPPVKKMKATGGGGGSSPAGAAPAGKQLKKWTCKVCTNKNLAHMCPKKCNNCQRPRVEVDDEYFSSDPDLIPDNLIDKKSDHSSHWRCVKCNNKNMTKYFPTTCNRCQRARSSEPEEHVTATSQDKEDKDQLDSAPDPFTRTTSTSTSNSTSNSSDVIPVQEPKLKRDHTTIANVSGSKRVRSAGADTDTNTKVKLVATSSEFWTCLVCKNRNICAVHKLTCNRCQRHRSSVEDRTTAPVVSGVVAPVSSPAAVAAAVAVAVAVTGQTPSTALSSNTHWSCLVCKNRNISAVHKLTCNRCQRHRSEVEDKSRPALTVPASDSPPVATSAVTHTSKNSMPAVSSPPLKPMWTCVKCKNKNLISLTLSACNRCQRPRADVDTARTTGKKNSQPPSVDDKEQNSWVTAVADKDLIKRNMQLREDYMNPETCKTLSEEDKQRAEVLIQRSQRKVEKKEKRNAWKKKLMKR